MTKRLVLVLFIWILLFALICLKSNITADVEASNGYPIHNLDTGLNYTTIQEAIEANETLNGHTIYVEEGIYNGNVFVNKSLSLIGENRSTTVIDGNKTNVLLCVIVNSVNISGFTFRNANCSILIENSKDNNVFDNFVTKSLYGISLINSVGNKLIDNVAFENAVAVNLSNSSYNQIKRNKIDSTNNSCIALWQSSTNNIIQYNDIGHSNCTGIYTNNSGNNTINFNNIYSNEGGIYLRDSNYNIVTDNNITFSTMTGLALRNLTHSSIFCNKIGDNPYGIYSANITCVSFCNNAINNSTYGIYTLWNMSNNIFEGNTIANNNYGVYLWGSNSNNFCHNNFLNNTQHVNIAPYGYANSWDNGLEGNYWSSYISVDLDPDGIYDSWYEINSNNVDHHPLVGIYSSFNTEYGYGVGFVSNSSISNFSFNLSSLPIFPPEAILAFNVLGEVGTQGFVRVCIPKILINGSYIVRFDGEVITRMTYSQVRELPCSNETYTYFYINYDHSEHTIVINGTTMVPEFSSFFILPLFFIVALALLAVIVVKRKKWITRESNVQF
jgi:parallel beta-helix repeat protein